MKSLVLKDLFNIGHNAKSMLFILVVFAVALIPFSGVEGYIFVCAILCSMMIVTTFSFDLAGIGELLFLALTAWVVSIILGSMSIPLVFKFGAEKGRVLLLISFLFPVALCFGIYQLFVILDIELTEHFMFALLCCSSIIALIWCYVMYQISYRIFTKQEL